MDLDKQYKSIFQAIADASPEDRKSVAADLIAVYPGDDKWFVDRSAKNFIRKLEDQDFEAAWKGGKTDNALHKSGKFAHEKPELNMDRADRFVSSLDSLIIDNSEAVGEPFDLFPDKDESTGKD